VGSKLGDGSGEVRRRVEVQGRGKTKVWVGEWVEDLRGCCIIRLQQSSTFEALGINQPDFGRIKAGWIPKLC